MQSIVHNVKSTHNDNAVFICVPLIAALHYPVASHLIVHMINQKSVFVSQSQRNGETLSCLCLVPIQYLTSTKEQVHLAMEWFTRYHLNTCSSTHSNQDMCCLTVTKDHFLT